MENMYDFISNTKTTHLNYILVSKEMFLLVIFSIDIAIFF